MECQRPGHPPNASVLLLRIDMLTEIPTVKRLPSKLKRHNLSNVREVKLR